jgi:hypothetical protein
MYANNRAVAKPRASFQIAGGSIFKYRHPFLVGQIEGANIDEIDVSRAMRLNETFFDAVPSQDSSFMEPLVDGSYIVVTNHLMGGTVTLQVLSTTGFVGTGDFIEAAHLIIASKDDIGGTLTVIQNIDGKRRITVFYGVSFKNVPHLKIAGNSVVPYPIVMNYAGWFSGLGESKTVSKKTIWAVGNRYGINGVYKPFDVQSAEKDDPQDYFVGSPFADQQGIGGGITKDDYTTETAVGVIGNEKDALLPTSYLNISGATRVSAPTAAA